MGSPAGSGPASVVGQTATITSRYPKLDGVLYHFYAKTSAVITSCRLTHFEGSEPLGGSSSTSSRQLRQLRRNSSESASASTATNPGVNRTGSTSGSTGRKVSKWFALDIDDQDVFRDEIRLWRNISTLIPNWLLDQPPSTLPHQGAAYVPPMFLDIVLDTSNLTSSHVLMIDELQDDRRTRRRVRVDGQDTGSSPRRSGERLEPQGDKEQRGRDEALDVHRESILLESWRLDFAIHNPPNPPDLPTLYKHATAHFREAYAFVTDLPSYALHKRLKQIWESNLERRRARTQEGNVNDLEEEQDEDDELANLLKVGVRMAIGRPGETEEGHIGLREPVGSMMHSSDGSGRVTRSYSFAPILTPVGSLSFSVEYRRNVDFYVEDWHVIQSMREIALDEDYFKPTMAKHLQRRASVQRQRQNSQGSLSSSPASFGDKRSLLAQTSSQKTGEEHPSSHSPSDTTAPKSTPSVFGTSLGSTSGRPVAGLSNLRASPSVAGYSASPATATLGSLASGNSGTSSPALSSALTSDAAFLTHTRRPSISSGSERRLRSFTSLGTGQDKESPPSPSVSGRPILSRTSISNAFPRSGSYTTSESAEDHSKSSNEGNSTSGTSRAITRRDDHHPSSPMQVSSIASSAFPRTRGLNRTQVDEMLQKMQNSVREYSTSVGTSRSSPASGGHATSSSGGQSQPGHSPPVQYGGLQSTSFTRSPLSRGSYSATTSTKPAVDQDVGSARKNVPMEAIASGDGVESRDVSLSNTHDRLLAAAPSVAPSRQEASSVAPIDTAQNTDQEGAADAKRDSREEARLSHSHPGRARSRGSLELYAPHSYDPLDDETAGRLELATDESLTEMRNAQAQGRQGFHGVSGISGGYANNNGTEEESRRRLANMELARNFTNTVSNRGGNGRSASTTGRTSMSPWRQRGFHPAPSGTVTNSPGDVHSTHFHSAHPYHHAHQSHLNASRHAQTTSSSNTPPANRSGRSSTVQPSSPAGSPPMD
ncbi:uncharacterized protein FA14DRAFT_12260 [Meira miltonrushii]|uniref:Autophagy-related protein 13 n=1 Tax=Meira miltonrushii TaxID=1280837 RepID=A0A316VHY9_9BASI|nr:uncharacterized protein FA14DRAFT_12260 [Meira miltonrushii]PWN37249.1 hypothetical protein FA14DRAFT_12260 [Meira miltonrushii]